MPKQVERRVACITIPSGEEGVKTIERLFASLDGTAEEMEAAWDAEYAANPGPDLLLTETKTE